MARSPDGVERERIVEGESVHTLVVGTLQANGAHHSPHTTHYLPPMSAPELAQLEMLAQVDELIARLSHWGEPESAWEPMNHCRALVRRLLTRVETLLIRLEAPLVVATFTSSRRVGPPGTSGGCSIVASRSRLS